MDDDRRCTATAKSTGERCQNAAIKGGAVCRVHGGSAPQVRQKADERLEEMAETAAEKMQNRMDELFEMLDDGDLTPEERLKVHKEMRQLSKLLWDRTGTGTGDDGSDVDVSVDVNTLDADEKSKLDALFDREVQQ